MRAGVLKRSAMGNRDENCARFFPQLPIFPPPIRSGGDRSGGWAHARHEGRRPKQLQGEARAHAWSLLAAQLFSRPVRRRRALCSSNAPGKASLREKTERARFPGSPALQSRPPS